jgi:hypothetical protein
MLIGKNLPAILALLPHHGFFSLLDPQNKKTNPVSVV